MPYSQVLNDAAAEWVAGAKVDDIDKQHYYEDPPFEIF
jgi:hypothetical protein